MQCAEKYAFTVTTQRKPLSHASQVYIGCLGRKNAGTRSYGNIFHGKPQSCLVSAERDPRRGGRTMMLPEAKNARNHVRRAKTMPFQFQATGHVELINVWDPI